MWRGKSVGRKKIWTSSVFSMTVIFSHSLHRHTPVYTAASFLSPQSVPQQEHFPGHVQHLRESPFTPFTPPCPCHSFLGAQLCWSRSLWCQRLIGSYQRLAKERTKQAPPSLWQQSSPNMRCIELCIYWFISLQGLKIKGMGSTPSFQLLLLHFCFQEYWLRPQLLRLLCLYGNTITKFSVLFYLLAWIALCHYYKASVHS